MLTRAPAEEGRFLCSTIESNIVLAHGSAVRGLLFFVDGFTKAAVASSVNDKDTNSASVMASNRSGEAPAEVAVNGDLTTLVVLISAITGDILVFTEVTK